MAEILISLTIIGVIAAITLPALRANINESAWNAQRKALYSRMSQAIAMMPTVKGYETSDKLITEGLSKVLKIDNICEPHSAKKCNVPSKIKSFHGRSINTSGLVYYADAHPTGRLWADEDKRAAFELANGESMLITSYNSNCALKDNIENPNFSDSLATSAACVNIMYDLNGRKGPNKYGKDIGALTIVYGLDSEVVLSPIQEDTYADFSSKSEALNFCKTNFANAKVPTLEELISLTNNSLLNDLPAIRIYSQTRSKLNSHNIILTDYGHLFYDNLTGTKVVCIKK